MTDIDELLVRATKRPWKHQFVLTDIRIYSEDGGDIISYNIFRQYDAELICYAVNNIEHLESENKRLRIELLGANEAIIAGKRAFKTHHKKASQAIEALVDRINKIYMDTIL